MVSADAAKRYFTEISVEGKDSCNFSESMDWSAGPSTKFARENLPQQIGPSVMMPPSSGRQPRSALQMNPSKGPMIDYEVYSTPRPLAARASRYTCENPEEFEMPQGPRDPAYPTHEESRAIYSQAHPPSFDDLIEQAVRELESDQ